MRRDETLSILIQSLKHSLQLGKSRHILTDWCKSQIISFKSSWRVSTLERCLPLKPHIFWAPLEEPRNISSRQKMLLYGHTPILSTRHILPVLFTSTASRHFSELFLCFLSQMCPPPERSVPFPSPLSLFTPYSAAVQTPALGIQQGSTVLGLTSLLGLVKAGGAYQNHFTFFTYISWTTWKSWGDFMHKAFLHPSQPSSQEI